MSAPTAADPHRIELGAQAPDFEAVSTAGMLRLSTYAPGQWVVFFSHPSDFTPVCTTEFIELARKADDFAARDTALLGTSIDSVYSHIAWLRSIEERTGVKVRFPVIADLDQKVARLYGMVHRPTAVTAAVRSVFFLDPDRNVRATLQYPLSVGRNVEEILRVIDALRLVDKHGVSCPANWKAGDEVIVPAPTTMDAAEQRAGAKDLQVTDWYLARKKVR